MAVLCPQVQSLLQWVALGFGARRLLPAVFCCCQLWWLARGQAVGRGQSPLPTCGANPLQHMAPPTIRAALTPPMRPLAAQELAEGEERLRGRSEELDAARGSLAAAGEALEEAEARGRELYEENKRLAEHIQVGGWMGAGVGG